jgi:hypothetical protein
MSVSPELKARVLGAARQEVSPDRKGVRRRAAKTWLVTAAFMLLFFGALGGLRAVERPLDFVLATGALWGIIALGASLVLARRRSMVGAPLGVLLTAVVVTPLLLLVSYGIAFGVDEVGLRTLGVAPVARAFTCFGISLVFAVGPFAALLFRRRGLALAHPRATSAAMGVMACAWGAVLMDLHCEHADLRHVFLGHVAPAALLACTGFVFGERLLGLRADTPLDARPKSSR